MGYTMQLKNGTELQGGRYKIEKILGQGGFGITYLAEQTGLGRKVAIKEFFMKEFCNRNAETSQVSVGSEGSSELVERFREKFLKEARRIASLEHKNIVPVIDVFEENGTAYYVMKYMGGGSLSDKVAAGALPEADAVRYIRQIASALDFVHGKLMMHLDVKPANVLLSDDDEAVLIDFGLAKQYDDAGTQTSTTPVGISHGYAPMEQYRRGGVGTFSPATDIYSLGATLYKLVTGSTPPEASDVNDDGLPALPQQLSANACATIEAAMQPRRKDRPQSVEAFVRMLDGSPMQRSAQRPLVEKTVIIDCDDTTECNDFQVDRSKENRIDNAYGTTKIADKPKGKSRFWVVLLIVLLLVGGVVGGIMMYGNRSHYKKYMKDSKKCDSTCMRDSWVYIIY